MAKLLATSDWSMADTLDVALSEALPDDYVVIERAALRGRQLDMVVIGPQGIFVLHVRDWAGEVIPMRGPTWVVRTATGQEQPFPNPAARVAQDNLVINELVRQMFPKLARVDINHLVVLTNPTATLAHGAAPELLITNPGNVAYVIMATTASAGSSLLDAETRLRLGSAFFEQQVAPTQRMVEPFIFRSGSLIGSGKKVWTIMDAVKHMDKHPEDGIYHLTNGTLAGWLERGGAHALATLARRVLDTRESDPRVPLEMFLIGSGLVPRPKIRVRPEPVNLGCVVSGQSCMGRVSVRKGRGRGYLYGALSASEPWLRVEPRSFRGQAVEAVVSVDTSTLPISPAGWQADILIDSNASATPLAIPVRVRVVGEPSGLNRYLVRPLLDAAVAGLFGALIGWVLGRWGNVGTPGDVLAPPVFWALSVGLIWLLFGAVRGLRQRAAWPACYATGRYALRISLWTIGMAAAPLVGLLLWGILSGQPGPHPISSGGVRVVMFWASLAIAPATLGELRAARHRSDVAIFTDRRALLGPFVAAGLAIALIAVIALAARLAQPAWQDLSSAGALENMQGWFEQRVSDLDAWVQKVVERAYLWRYDRPAP